MARGEFIREPAPPFSALITCARAVWQVSSWCGRRERHAAADSTVKMVTNGLEHRHPAAHGQPRPAGGFISVELVAAAAAASIFVLDCPRCTGRVPAWTDDPPARLPPRALETAWPGT